MRRTYAPPKRRGSKLPWILAILLIAIIGAIIWLSTLDTEVPQQRIEQDVTNAALAQ